MRAHNDDSGPTAVVEAYGAQMAVTGPDAEVLQTILEGLPRGWTLCGDDVDHELIRWRFAVLRDGDGIRIRDDHGHEHGVADLALAITMLRTQMRRFVGYHAQELIFVHAGVVAVDGAGILLPGRSFAGKSTLVQALARAGAEFYSDEYGMLTPDGRVAHYRDPLSVRGPRGQEDVHIGSGQPHEPVPLGLVVLTTYRPGASWEPRALTKGEGLVATLEHAVPARDRPAETLETIRRALADAQILQGERGEADETAGALLELMRRR